MKLTVGLLIAAVCSVAVRTSIQSSFATTLPAAESEQEYSQRLENYRKAKEVVGNFLDSKTLAKKPAARFPEVTQERLKVKQGAEESDRGDDQQVDNQCNCSGCFSPPSQKVAVQPGQSECDCSKCDQNSIVSKPNGPLNPPTYPAAPQSKEICQQCIPRTTFQGKSSKNIQQLGGWICQPCTPEQQSSIHRQSSNPSLSGRNSPMASRQSLQSASSSETMNPSAQNLEITIANNANDGTADASRGGCEKCCNKKNVLIGTCVCVVTAAALGCNIM